MGDPIIEIEDMTFSYDGEIILQDVTLDIDQGDYVAMIGPNGSGKTTLLRLILGLLEPDRGTISVMGQSPSRASSSIGYVPQDVHINSGFPITALDVVLMGKLNPRKRWAGKSGSNRRDALDALDRLGMASYADNRIGLLSGGQRQRVFIARALVTNPRLLLLDEPTASIDTKGQTDFYSLLEELNGDATVLVVSHDLLSISPYVKSVACVNKRLHYHSQAEVAGGMLDILCPCTVEEACPVEIVAHGLPRRLLKGHPEEND